MPGKILDFPIILMGQEYWGPLLKFLRGTLLEQQTINSLDVDRIIVTDSPQEAARVAREAGLRKFGLTSRKGARAWG